MTFFETQNFDIMWSILISMKKHHFSLGYVSYKYLIIRSYFEIHRFHHNIFKSIEKKAKDLKNIHWFNQNFTFPSKKFPVFFLQVSRYSPSNFSLFSSNSTYFSRKKYRKFYEKLKRFDRKFLMTFVAFFGLFRFE